MIGISVSAIKGGSRDLYQVNSMPLGISSAIRKDSGSPYSVGKEAYSIFILNDGILFTKCRITRDGLRNDGVGNISFSVFIPNTAKLTGDDIKEILDKLIDGYKKYLDQDDTIKSVSEDWSYVLDLSENFNKKLIKQSTDEANNYQRGIGDAAFIYYLDKTELCKFFDNPYQEEYSAHKQIFFVEKTLEGKPENPLNALRHDPNADLTGKIDLENPKYKLIYNQNARGGVKIEVKINGSLRNSKSNVKRKEDLQIIWSKQFCETKVKNGRWYEIGSEYLEINDVEKTITIKEIDIHPTTYTITIHTKDRFSNPITDAAITLKIGNYSLGRNAINNTIQITEEELQNKCYIIAQKDNLISPQREIKREDTKGSISLTLSEHKKVKILISDDQGLVYNFKIQISNKEVQPKDGDVVFIGDEIEKTWQISVSHRDYETEKFDYCPAKDDNPKYVILKKKTFSGQGQSPNRKKYYIKIDEKKGKRSYKSSTIKEYEYKHPQFKCDSKYGYKFERWECFEKPYDNYDGYYEAVFKELWYRKAPKLAFIFVIIAIVASTVFLLVNSSRSVIKTGNVNDEINNKVNSYIEGIEFNLDTLREYKKKYCDSTTNNQSDGKEKGLWKKIWIFSSEDNGNSTNGSSVIPDFCSKIDNAIAIRNAINLGKIDELKGQVFSESQQNLKNSIDSIDNKCKQQIRDSLYKSKVSAMNLNQVADFIKKVQSDLKEKETIIQKETEPIKNTIQEKQNEQKIKDQQKTNTQNQQNSQSQKQQSSSISLDKEFWDLVHSGNAQKDSYSKLLNKHQNKGGDIIEYLNKICKNSASFKKFKDIPEMDRKLANTLTDIDINQ